MSRTVYPEEFNQNQISINTNQMYKFDDSFYLYLKKVNDNYIYGHYSASAGTNNEPNDKFHEVNLVVFVDIKKISIKLDEQKIYVDIDFITKKNTIKSTELASGYSHYTFKSFTEASEFINLICKLVYNNDLIIPNNKEAKIHQNYENLDDFEKSLLFNSFNAPYTDNICVSETFRSKQLKYYYDIKLFEFGNKTILMLYDVQEGYYPHCDIMFVDKLVLLRSNNSDEENEYSIDLFDISNDKKIKIDRLNKENYSILHQWIKQKLE